MYSERGAGKFILLIAGIIVLILIATYDSGRGVFQSPEEDFEDLKEDEEEVVFLQPSASGVQVSWQYTSQGGPATGAFVERDMSSSFSNPAQVCNVQTPINNCLDSISGLVVGTTYYYRVIAYNAAGNSPPSASSSIIVSLPIPSPSSVVTATLVSATQINLAWVDSSTTENYFEIERNSGSGFIFLTFVSVNIASYSDTSVIQGNSYTYRVRACNSLGQCSSYVNSNAVSVTVPAGPSGLSTTSVTSTQVGLSWIDNANNEDRFLVQRRDITGLSPPYPPFVTISVSPHVSPSSGVGGTVGYVDSNVAAGNTYEYRIIAVNVVGSSSEQPVLAVNVPQLLIPPSAPSGLTATLQ